MDTKSQSAMEYLMTYGWAILIIAVILGALYQVGVFNPYTFSPKVGAGACKVARGIVDGQVTSSKVGTCNNALPQYVGNFDGSSSYVSVSSSLNLGTVRTYTAWIKTSAIGPAQQYVVGDSGGTNSESMGLSASGSLWLDFGGVVYGTSPSSLPVNAWEFVAIRINSTYTTSYINGIAQTSSASSLGFGKGPFTMGKWVGGGAFFNGYISNVQVYNSSLTSNEITALYKEGIGGVPINAVNLTGWWPFNGDTKDYSGNGNNGTPVNVLFTGSWVNGYAAP